MLFPFLTTLPSTSYSFPSPGTELKIWKLEAIVADDCPSESVGIRAKKHAESMIRDEMPPWPVLEGVRWIDVVVKFRIAVGTGVED